MSMKRTTTKPATKTRTSRKTRAPKPTAATSDEIKEPNAMSTNAAPVTPNTNLSNASNAMEPSTSSPSASLESNVPTGAVAPAAPLPQPAPSPPPAPQPAGGIGSAPIAGSPGFLPAPPPITGIPSPPAGFVANNVMDFRGVLPRTSELNALPIAVKELAAFSDYAQVLGATAPPLAQVQPVCTITNEWSATRTESAAWDEYCRTQEGIAWSILRPMMNQLRPAFELAATLDATLAGRFPGLTTLLGAKKAIAKKAAATKKKNKPQKSAGQTPTHGKVGKKATKAAEKAALAAQQKAAAAPPPTATITPPATPPPAAPTH